MFIIDVLWTLAIRFACALSNYTLPLITRKGPVKPALSNSKFTNRGLQQRHNQQRHDIDDLDHRVDRRAGGVLVGIAHGVAGDGGLVRVRTLAAVLAVFDELLGVVPDTANRGGRRPLSGGRRGQLI